VQMTDLIRDVVASFAPRLPSGVTIETQFEPALPVVPASPSEMQQVLLNLVNNAIDALDEKGGVVTIRTRTEADQVVIEVADNGQGIPASQLTRIFEPFFTTKPVGEGTGLGLSICYGLVRKHGGDITVESEPGVGSTFRVRLPIRSAEESRNKTAS